VRADSPLGLVSGSVQINLGSFTLQQIGNTLIKGVDASSAVRLALEPKWLEPKPSRLEPLLILYPGGGLRPPPA